MMEMIFLFILMFAVSWWWQGREEREHRRDQRIRELENEVARLAAEKRHAEH
jgi:preprotein translocase subunit YajC